MNKIFDALIIGAGPAGAATALFLAQKGFEVALIESSPQIKRKVCGEYLCPKGVGLLKKLNLYNALAEGFLPVSGMDLFSPFDTMISAPFPDRDGTQEGLSINRQIFDSRLVKMAEDYGAEVYLGEKIVSIKTNAETNNWVLTSSRSQRWNGQLLIGADGRKSSVAQHLHVQKDPNTKRIALHCYIAGDAFPSRQGEMHLFKDGGYIGINPIHSGEVNFSLVSDVDKIQAHGGPINAFNYYVTQSRSLSKRLGAVFPQDKVYAVTPVDNHVSDVVGSNWALIGDAGGFVDPLTGEGIYNALLTAHLLSEEMGSKAENKNLKKALQRYSQTRRKMMQPKSKMNRGFQWLIRRPRSVERVAQFLKARPARASAFIGIVGNVYRPVEGLRKMFTNKE